MTGFRSRNMSFAERQRRIARQSFWGSVVIGLGVSVYFSIQGELVTASVIGTLLIGGGYLEYRRRIRDLDTTDGGDEDPFEKRERLR